jgi:glycosyltransferase involved in cell wall biosynthesis
LRVIAYTDAVAFGGAEEVLGHLLGALPASFAMTVVGVDGAVVGAIASRRPSCARALVPPAANKGDVGGIAAHVRTFRRLKPDIVHVSLRTPWTCQAGIVAGLLSGAPVIATEHLPIPSASAGQRASKRFLSRRLAAHVAVGDRAARLVEGYARLPEGSVRTIYNGVPELPIRTAERLAPGLIVGSLGRLDVQKGYDTLLRALPALPGVTAVLVGDGPQRPMLELLAAELGVADRVRLTGWSDDPRSYLPGFDVFVLPSRYEGFPLSIVEAMQAGLPVVASDVGSVGEAVVPGETGLLVPADEPERLTQALLEALREPQRRRLGEGGRRRAGELFSLGRMASEYERLYREVVRGGR